MGSTVNYNASIDLNKNQFLNSLIKAIREGQTYADSNGIQVAVGVNQKTLDDIAEKIKSLNNTQLNKLFNDKNTVKSIEEYKKQLADVASQIDSINKSAKKINMDSLSKKLNEAFNKYQINPTNKTMQNAFINNMKKYVGYGGDLNSSALETNLVKQYEELSKLNNKNYIPIDKIQKLSVLSAEASANLQKLKAQQAALNNEIARAGVEIAERNFNKLYADIEPELSEDFYAQAKKLLDSIELIKKVTLTPILSDSFVSDANNLINGVNKNTNDTAKKSNKSSKNPTKSSKNSTKSSKNSKDTVKNEEVELDSLRVSVDTVTNAFDEKTNAIVKEGATLKRVATSEISELKKMGKEVDKLRTKYGNLNKARKKRNNAKKVKDNASNSQTDNGGIAEDLADATENARLTEQAMKDLRQEFINIAEAEQIAFNKDSLKVDNTGVITFTRNIEEADGSITKVSYKIQDLKSAINTFGSLSNTLGNTATSVLKNNAQAVVDIEETITAKAKEINKFQVSTGIEDNLLNMKSSFERLNAELRESSLDVETYKEKVDGLVSEFNLISQRNTKINTFDVNVSADAPAKLQELRTQISRLNTELQEGTISTTEYANAADSLIGKYSTWENAQSKINIAGIDPSLYTEMNAKIEELNAKLNNGTLSADAYNRKIKELVSNYKKMSSSGNIFKRDITSLEQAREAANSYISTLGNVTVLKELRSSDTPTNGMYKMTAQIKNTNGAVQNLKFTYNTAMNTMSVTTEHLRSEVTGLGEVVGEFKKKINQLVLYWTANMINPYQIINVVRRGVSVVHTLDDALTEMRKVSDESISSLKAFQMQSFETASSIGTTSAQIQNSAADFMRLGYTLKEATKLSKDANIYANVGDMDISEATEHMISSIQAWKSEFSSTTETSEAIIDRYNKIGNEFAITSADIGSAMERSAAALKAGGNTLNESIGLITAGNLIQQDADTTANALKVVSLRIRGAKTELESLGEDTDNLADSTSKMRAELKALTGVDIMLDENTFKSTAKIIQEIGENWDKLTDVSQAATLEKLAGKTRASTIAGLIENYETIADVMDTASDAEGSALEENAKYLDSVDGKLQQLTNEAQKFWYILLHAEDVKKITGALTDVLHVVNKITEGLGTIPTILGTVSGLISAISNKGFFKTLSENEASNATSLEKFKSLFTSITNFGKRASALGSAQPLLTIPNLNTDELTGFLSKFQEIDTLAKTNANAWQEFSDKLSEGQKWLAVYGQSTMGTVRSLDSLRLAQDEARAAALRHNEAIIAQNKSTTLATIGWGLLRGALNAGIWIVVFKAIEGVIKVITNVTHAAEKANEAFTDSENQFKQTESELETLNSELKNAQEKIEELEGYPSLSFIEESELEKLKEATKELERQIDLKEDAALASAEDTYKKGKKAFNNTFGDYTKTDIYDTFLPNQFIHSIDLSSTMELLTGYQAVKKKLSKKLSESERVDYEKALETIENNLKESDVQNDIRDKITDVSGYIQNIYDIKKYRELTAEEEKQLEIYRQLEKSLYSIYENKGNWNNAEYNSLFSTDELKNTESELKELAKQGELTKEVLSKDYPDIVESLKNTDFILEDGQSPIDALIHEIYASVRSKPYEEARKELISYIRQYLGLDDTKSWIDSLSPQEVILAASDEFKEEVENSAKNYSITLEDAKKNLEDEYEKLQDWGLGGYEDALKNGTMSSVLGNIDMDDRVLINWTESEIEKSKEALKAIKNYDSEGNFIDTYYDELKESVANGEHVVDTVYGAFIDNIKGFKGIDAVSFSHIVNNDDGTYEMLGQQTAEEYILGILDIAKKDGDLSIDHILELDKQGIKDAEVYDANGKIIGQTFIHGIISGFNEEAETNSMLTHFIGLFGSIGLANKDIKNAENGYNKIIYSVVTFQKALAKILKQKQEIQDTGFSYTEHEEDLKLFDEDMEKISEAYKKLQANELSASDKIKLFREFPQLRAYADDLSTGLKKLVYSDLESLYKKLGENVPDYLKEELAKLAQQALMTSSTLEDSYSSLTSSYEAMVDMQEAINKGVVTSDVLKTISSLGGEMANAVALYNSGLITSVELFDLVKEHYQVDLQNYITCLIEKNKYNTDFYTKLGFKDSEVINKFKENYGVDLKNCETYADAKLQIEMQTLEAISAGWQKYYNAQANAYTQDFYELGKKAAKNTGFGIPDAKNEELKLYNEIYSKVQSYRGASKAMEEITNKAVDTGFQSVQANLKSADEATDKAASETETKWKELLDKEIELEEARFNAGIIDLQEYLTRRLSLIQKYYNEAKITSEEYYSEIKELYEAELEIFDKALSAVQKLFEDEIDKIDKSIEAINKKNDALNEEKEKYDNIISAVEDVFDTETEKINEQIDALEEKNDKLEEEQQKYEDVLSAIDKVYDTQIEGYEKEKDRIQDIIDSLQDENDEREREIALMKAKYELERAQNQRTQYVYQDGQMVYKADESAIRDAKEALDDAEFDKTVADLNKQIDEIEKNIEALEKMKEKWQEVANARKEALEYQAGIDMFGDKFAEYILNSGDKDINDFLNKYNKVLGEIDDNTKLIDGYNEKIKYYEKLKKNWTDLSSQHEKNVNKQLATEKFGAEWEAKVLSGKLDDFENFKNKYLEIQQEVTNNEKLIKDLEEKKTYYEGLKDEWDKVSSAYEDGMEKQVAAMVFGQDWEEKVLNNRENVLEGFKNTYINLQHEIANASVEAAKASITALQAETSAAATAIGYIQTATDNLNEHIYNTKKNLEDLSNSYDEINNNNNNPKPSGGGGGGGGKKYNTVSKFAKGGIVEKSTDPIIRKIANSMGEDTLIAAKEGERVLTADQNAHFEKLVDTKSTTYTPVNLIRMLSSADMDNVVKAAQASRNSLGNTVVRSSYEQSGLQNYVRQVNVDQHITLTLPNVTNNTGVEYLQKTLGNITQKAYQMINKH